MKRSTGGSDLWTTPEFLLRRVRQDLGEIDMDLFASAENAVAEQYCDDIETLAAQVTSRRPLTRWSHAWANPPYSKMRMVTKAILALLRAQACKRITMLIPASRTEQAWFQLLLKRAHKAIYLSPRMPFAENGVLRSGCNHASMLLVFGLGEPPMGRQEVLYWDLRQEVADALRAQQDALETSEEAGHE